MGAEGYVMLALVPFISVSIHCTAIA
jgi:hypothetical protein